MTPPKRLLTAVARLLPLGAVGVSVALAAAPAKAANAAAAQDVSVAQRLQAIRSAVSQATAAETGLQPGDPAIQKAWWGNWHPGFWGNGGWRNWHNGWGNGGWHNWHNGWGNGGWHNWHNFWRNW